MTMLAFDHFSEVDLQQWPLPHFLPEELACREGGRVFTHLETGLALEKLRDRMQSPLKINSAYRTPQYNLKVGGAKMSMHLKGRAFDIHCPTVLFAVQVMLNARELGFGGIGYYPRQHFVHIDSGIFREWTG
jgi:uncharacterized protein YcbK (DUF882 family)